MRSCTCTPLLAPPVTVRLVGRAARTQRLNFAIVQRESPIFPPFHLHLSTQCGSSDCLFGARLARLGPWPICADWNLPLRRRRPASQARAHDSAHYGRILPTATLPPSPSSTIVDADKTPSDLCRYARSNCSTSGSSPNARPLRRAVCATKLVS